MTTRARVWTAAVAVAFFCEGCGPSAGSGLPADLGATADSAASDAGLDAGLGDADVCLSNSLTAEAAALPADIVWIIDNSGSMSEEEGYVQTNMNAYSQSLAQSVNDYRVIVITATSHITIPPPLGGSPRFLAVDQIVQSHDALNLIISTYPQWQGFLRPGSVKHFVVVSDDNSSMSAATFKQQIAALTNPGFPSGFFLHAVVAENLGMSFPPGPCASKAADVGTNYLALQQQTGGVFSSLCQSDWTPVFAALAQAVKSASTIPCTFAIPPPPAGVTLDYGHVNLVYTPLGGTATYVPFVTAAANCGPAGGWYYDNPGAPSQMLTCPATCTTFTGDTTGTVSIAFGCATVIP